MYSVAGLVVGCDPVDGRVPGGLADEGDLFSGVGGDRG